MITMAEMIENGEKEKSTIEYEYDLEKVCKEYTEDDLYFYESGNRMGGLGGIIILLKDNKYRLLFIDEENELLYKSFPNVMNAEMEMFKVDYKNYINNKYEWYFTGFGGKLYIDRRIVDEFKIEMYSFFRSIGVPIEKGEPHEQVLHAYWITLAKDVLNKKIKEKDNHNPFCPKCRKELAKITYGLSSQPNEVLKKENKYNGGCCMFGDSPKYHCYTCNKDFMEDLNEMTEKEVKNNEK